MVLQWVGNKPTAWSWYCDRSIDHNLLMKSVVSQSLDGCMCALVYRSVLTGWNYLRVQSHIGVMETTTDNQATLLMGLDYLIGISYVDDTEVFKVCRKVTMTCCVGFRRPVNEVSRCGVGLISWDCFCGIDYNHEGSQVRRVDTPTRGSVEVGCNHWINVQNCRMQDKSKYNPRRKVKMEGYRKFISQS